MITKLTVVIPTNRTKYLDEAINSINGQHNFKCNILIVDDGATPSIESQIGKQYPNLKYIKHSKNKGLPASRNTGVKAVKTEFLVFLDCDDLLKPNFVQEMISTCEKNNWQACVCLPDFFFSHGFPINRKIIFFLLSIIRDLLLLFSYIFNHKCLSRDGFFLVQSSHVIFKTALLRRFPSDESYLTAANDWKLMAEILAQEKVGILPKKLSCYRYHYQSQSQSRNTVSKWVYYDRMLREIPNVCQKGSLVNFFKMYNFLGHRLLSS